MTDVEIEYCVPCGHLDTAQELQADILSEFGLAVDGVRLTTGDGGVFTVTVDGEQVFDKAEEAYDPGEIVDRVRERLSATRAPDRLHRASTGERPATGPTLPVERDCHRVAVGPDVPDLGPALDVEHHQPDDEAAVRDGRPEHWSAARDGDVGRGGDGRGRQVVAGRPDRPGEDGREPGVQSPAGEFRA